MDFELTKSQKEIQKAARDFAKGEFDKDLALELDKKHEFPEKIWKKAADLGFIGIHFPEQYSGQGLGVIGEHFSCRRVLQQGFHHRQCSDTCRVLHLNAFCVLAATPLRKNFCRPLQRAKCFLPERLQSLIMVPILQGWIRQRKRMGTNGS